MLIITLRVTPCLTFRRIIMCILGICRLNLSRLRFPWPLVPNLAKAMRRRFFVVMENIKVVLLSNSLLGVLLHMLTLSVIRPFFIVPIALFLFISTWLEVDGLRRSGVV